VFGDVDISLATFKNRKDSNAPNSGAEQIVSADFSDRVGLRLRARLAIMPERKQWNGKTERIPSTQLET